MSIYYVVTCPVIRHALILKHLIHPKSPLHHGFESVRRVYQKRKKCMKSIKRAAYICTCAKYRNKKLLISTSNNSIRPGILHLSNT